MIEKIIQCLRFFGVSKDGLGSEIAVRRIWEMVMMKFVFKDIKINTSMPLKSCHVIWKVRMGLLWGPSW